jgi:hypothetical protein
MRKFFSLFMMVLVIVSLSMAVEIDLGVSIEVKQVLEQTLACARLSILANVGVFEFDIPFSQVWPSERKFEFVDPLQTYAGFNFKLPITILYVKAGLGVQAAGVIDLMAGKIQGWDLPSKARLALGVSESGLYLEGGISLGFTPALDNLFFCPYASVGVVF